MKLKQYIGNTIYIVNDNYFADGFFGKLDIIQSRSGEFYNYLVNGVQFSDSDIINIDNECVGDILVTLK